MRGRIFSILLLITASLGADAFAAHAKSCDKPWIFFDLGNTLVDTSDWAHLKHMPGARDYITQLKAKGYTVGLIVNVPEDWGKSYDEKLQYLKKFTAASWAESAPFEWDEYKAILLPPNDQDRKPAPYLFLEALSLGSPCDVIYEGEEAEEIRAATSAGLKAFQVGQPGAASFYLPVERIPDFIKPGRPHVGL